MKRHIKPAVFGIVSLAAFLSTASVTLGDPIPQQAEPDEIVTTAQGGLVDDIVNAIIGPVTNIVNAARNVITSAITGVRNIATDAKNGVDEIVINVRQGLNVLNDDNDLVTTASVNDMISEAVDTLKRVIAQELQGRDEFLGATGCSPTVCEPFRDDLISLLENIQTISNCLYAITEQGEVQVDLSREIEIIEGLPGRLLFPLYRVLGVDSKVFESGLIAQLNDLAQNLIAVKKFFIETACDPVWDDTERATTIVRRITSAISALKLIGKGMISVGETELFGDAGIHGYVHVNVKANPLKTWGERLLGLGESIEPVVAFAGRKVDYCIDLQKQQQMEAAVMHGQQEILDAIKSIQVPQGSGPDLDNDGDTDLMDFAKFQLHFSGPAVSQGRLAARP